MTEQNIQQQKQFNVLLIGDDCIDVYQFGTVDRLSPEAPVPVFKMGSKEERPGMARNVKANLEELGCRVNYLTGRTSVKTRLIDERSGQHIVRVDDDAFSDPIQIFTDIPPSYDAIVISDYNKGSVSYSLINELRGAYDGPIFIDTKKKDLRKIPNCYIKINQSEYEQLQTYPLKSLLIVTMGKEGAHYDGEQYAAPKVQVVDVTGAGDTFLASLVYQFLQTNSIKQSIPFAIKASSLTVQKLGVYAPTLEEICV